MKVNVGWQAVIALAVVALVAYALWKAKGVVGKIADVVATDLNPVSDQNIVYRGASAVTQKITGNESDTLGTALYNVTHDDCGGWRWPWSDSQCK